MIYFSYKVILKDIWVFDGAFVVTILFGFIKFLCFSGNKWCPGGSESIPRLYLTIYDRGGIVTP